MNHKIKEILKKVIFTSTIPSATRIATDRELKKYFKKLKFGKVLDIGSKNSPYKKLISHTKYLSLDISKESSPDMVGDIHKLKGYGSFFDTLVCIYVLEHLYNPKKAIEQMHRILKKGGICILAVPFMIKYHPDPKDYYRFTKQGLEYLFKDFNKVKIIPIGNKILTIWEMLNDSWMKSLVFNIFNPLIASIKFKKTRFHTGFVIIAEK